MSVYKFAINGEEHDIQGSGGEVQSPLTAGNGIEISNDVVSNTGVLSLNGKSGDLLETVYSGDNGQRYGVKVSTNPPAAGTADNIITIRKVL